VVVNRKSRLAGADRSGLHSTTVLYYYGCGFVVSALRTARVVLTTNVLPSTGSVSLEEKGYFVNPSLVAARLYSAVVLWVLWVLWA
jgi:hypothetical protein